MSLLTDTFNRIASEIATGENRLGVSAELAQAFGWGSGSTRVRSVGDKQTPLPLSRTYVGAESAVLFATSREKLNAEILDRTAMYGYQASIPWGIAASPDGAVLFNSHWLRDSEWFRLPEMSWEELSSRTDLIEALSPSGMLKGHAERVVTQGYTPDQTLRQVDDALVDRLDFWRSEALRHTRGVRGIDDKLQTLFAQLFVLRTIEDRVLAVELGTLESVLRPHGDVDRDHFHALFQKAKDLVGAELFDVDVTEELPSFVLGGIVTDLYQPIGLPRAGGRYNFAWIDADVLGLAYEKYLSTVLTPSPVAPQLALFNQPLREVERVSVRKAGGVYYTPPFLVQYLAEQCIEQTLKTSGEDHIPFVADFACGSGSFLVAAVDVLIQRLRQRDPHKNWARELVGGKHILGIDVDAKAVTMARLNLWTRFAQEPDPLPLPRLAEIVVHGDSLSEEIWNGLPEEYDVILGNPPFLATGHTPDREDLARRFTTAQGRYDYSYLFVELAVSKLRNEGLLGMVVPNRLFRNRDASTIRQILTDETDLLTVVDFGSNQIFDGATAYVGTIVAVKRGAGEHDRSANLRAVIVDEIGHSFLGAVLANASNVHGAQQNDFVSAYNAIHPRGGNPWLLLSDSEKTTRARLEEDAETLGNYCGIYQGIRTGGNDFFIVVVDPGSSGALCRITNGLGESALIERAIIRPAIFGAEIQRYDVIAPTKHLIYPYRNNMLIGESELEQAYPKAFEYFSRYRDILAGRASIQSAGMKWYELVRKRDESWLNKPKLLIRDLATATSFAIDQTGSTFLIGGTAVVPADPSILPALLGYLNSKRISNYLSEITPSFRGGFQKFEPQHLQRVPVLNDLISGATLADRIAECAGAILMAKESGRATEQLEYEAKIEDLLAAKLDDV